jgi:hypothetical protein
MGMVSPKPFESFLPPIFGLTGKYSRKHLLAMRLAKWGSAHLGETVAWSDDFS